MSLPSRIGPATLAAFAVALAAPFTVSAGTSATGGTQTLVGTDCVHTFTNAGTFVVSTGLANVQILLVGGGGAGGSNCGGGGGAGGVVYLTNIILAAGSYTVNVGTGGVNLSTQAVGGRGGDSSFGTLTNAFGGGGGGCWNGQSPTSGGSGGGGGGAQASSLWVGAAGIPGQGCDGGVGGAQCGGGGGGAATNGTDATTTTGGVGGDGVTNSISGAAVVYGGGGGGSVCNAVDYVPGAGGAGGGGTGGNAAKSLSATAGTDGRGGGGGGGSNGSGVAAYGGTGGRGVVIVRYPYFTDENPIPAVTMNPVADITRTSATVSGTLLFLGGGASSCGVLAVYGTSADNLCYTNELGTLTAAGAVNGTLTGLSHSTTYYAALLVTNNLGYSALSSVVSFHTIVKFLPENFLYQSTITVPGYTGSSTLTNFPVLVRLAENSPAGFHYADCAADGSDLRFADAAGTMIASEIEHWDVAGTSCVWVTVGALAGTDTSFTLYYGTYKNALATDPLAVGAIWTNAAYCGVWHCETNTAAGTIMESANGLVSGLTNSSAFSFPAGKTGNGIHNATAAAYVSTSNASVWAALGGTVTASVWVNADAAWSNYPRFLSCRVGNWDASTNGFDLGWQTGGTAMCGYQTSQVYFTSAVRSNPKAWYYFTAVYNGGNISYYENGVLVGTQAGVILDPVSGLFFFQNSPTETGSLFSGSLDEIRLRHAASSADWIKAEYDSMNSGTFAVAAAVTEVAHGSAGFVIRIDGHDVTVPSAWIASNCATAVALGDAAVSNALVTAGANGYARWESYALGLDPNDPVSVVLCDAHQDAAATTVTFAARNVVPATNEAFTVNYVLEGSADGVTWPYSLTSTTNALPLPLPAASKFFRVRADLVIQ